MTKKLTTLRSNIKSLYDNNSKVLLYHGWHHIQFVAKKAVIFAESIGADAEIVEASALVHDLNYVVEVNSEPDAGTKLRTKMLGDAGYTEMEIARIEQIISEAHTGTRGSAITPEGMALSDADTLFKALPITPILFAGSYITQNKVDIAKLADKVVAEQKPLFDQGIYFYTDLAKEKYLEWAKVNLNLWQNVKGSLLDEDVQEVIRLAGERGVL